MRLQENEIMIIKNSIALYIKSARVLLFGSRVDDSKKGGDIDIFVETNQDITIKDKIKILANIEIQGISRKVDLIIKTPLSKHKSIFNTALETGIEL